jgi:hypothetical protein
MALSDIGCTDINPAESAPTVAVIAAERAERLAQPARRVHAIGSLAGKAVTGGGATVADRLPCDPVIADNPESEPSQGKLCGNRRGLMPTGGLESLVRISILRNSRRQLRYSQLNVRSAWRSARGVCSRSVHSQDKP